MLRNTCGLIVADDRKIQLGELSHPRALSAMPFGGRYRIIDFHLSNMVNSGIRQIGITTYNKYKSLMDHIGTGSAWDLDTKRQGLFFLTPFINSESYGTGPDDISGILNLYRELTQEYILITGPNVIMSASFDEMRDYHEDKKADITVMYNREGDKASGPLTILDMTRAGRIKGVYQDPINPVSNRLMLPVFFMRRELFIELLGEAMSTGQTVMNLLDIIKLFDRFKVQGYEYKGMALRINSTQDYFNATMASLDEPVRSATYWGEKPIFTKVKDEAPAIYSDSCVVSDSMISDGCVISGTVEHSMLFRGVTIGGQTKVKNSIIFQDSHVSEGCELENVIIDKDCYIRPGIKLIGQAGYPVVIGKGAIV